MENWQTALVIILAIFVGACIPALIQLLMTLRNLSQLIARTDRFIAHNSSGFERAVGEVSQVATHLNRASSTVEMGAHQITSLLEALGGITAWVLSLRRSLGLASIIGAAVAPAMGEAIRALKKEDPEAKAENHGEPPNELKKSGNHVEQEIRS